MALLKRTQHSSHCPHKGDAAYYSIEVDGRVAENAIWTYETPFDGGVADRGTSCLLPQPRRRVRGDGLSLPPRPARIEC